MANQPASQLCEGHDPESLTRCTEPAEFMVEFANPIRFGTNAYACEDHLAEAIRFGIDVLEAEVERSSYHVRVAKYDPTQSEDFPTYEPD